MFVAVLLFPLVQLAFSVPTGEECGHRGDICPERRMAPWFHCFVGCQGDQKCQDHCRNSGRMAPWFHCFVGCKGNQKCKDRCRPSGRSAPELELDGENRNNNCGITGCPVCVKKCGGKDNACYLPCVRGKHRGRFQRG